MKDYKQYLWNSRRESDYPLTLEFPLQYSKERSMKGIATSPRFHAGNIYTVDVNGCITVRNEHN